MRAELPAKPQQIARANQEPESPRGRAGPALRSDGTASQASTRDRRKFATDLRGVSAA